MEGRRPKPATQSPISIKESMWFGLAASVPKNRAAPAHIIALFSFQRASSRLADLSISGRLT
jgi:hypothetical protein